jgi:hypothetical protein
MTRLANGTNEPVEAAMHGAVTICGTDPYILEGDVPPPARSTPNADTSALTAVLSR